MATPGLHRSAPQAVPSAARFNRPVDQVPLNLLITAFGRASRFSTSPSPWEDREELAGRASGAFPSCLPGRQPALQLDAYATAITPGVPEVR